jgi:hypothetical protein
MGLCEAVAWTAEAEAECTESMKWDAMRRLQLKHAEAQSYRKVQVLHAWG